MAKKTNLPDFFEAVGGGVTGAVLAQTLSDAATSVLVHQNKKSAKVSVEFTLSRMSEDNDSLKIEAKLNHKMPTARGEKSENETRESIHYLDQNNGLVDVPPRRKDEDQHASMANALPAGVSMHRGS